MHHDLIKQLHFVDIEQRGEALDGGMFRQIFRQCRRHRLRQRNLMQQRTEVAQCSPIRQTTQRHFVGHSQQRRTIARCQAVHQAQQIRLIQCTKHALHGIQRDLTRRIRNRLISQRQRIAHRTVRTLRQ